ncbi:MAG: GNAT family N-acetyltransferase [Saprospiraceae bacterium]|nr:GNAT family N-acetyltransferase [Saprospiraceae bacterium]
MLSGKKTYLRAIEKDDLPILLNWRNKPHMRKFFREYRELGDDQQMTWYQNIVLGDDRVRMFAILNSEKQLIGACGLCYIDWVNRNADFSIYIGHNDIYIDDDLAIDVSNIMIKYAFEELNLHRLWAEIYDIDSSKTKMFNTLGFKLDGRHRETHWAEGKWCDSLFFGLLSTDKR